MLLGLSAGVLAYVGASHLLPEVESENEALSIFTVGAGVLVGVLIIALKG
jgi:ZIP family zinc transporter/zinc and cadmium transporter